MRRLLLILAMAVPLASAHGAWVDAQGRAMADTPSMRSSGDFGAQLILTADGKAFRDAWNGTKGTPVLASADKVRLGESISGMVVFGGCQDGAGQVCRVSVEFFLQGPDGKITPAGSGPVWTSKAPAPRVLMLGLASVQLGFDKIEPVGRYQLMAHVTDHVAKRTLKLTSAFTVTGQTLPK